MIILCCNLFHGLENLGEGDAQACEYPFRDYEGIGLSAEQLFRVVQDFGASHDTLRISRAYLLEVGDVLAQTQILLNIYQL